MSTETGFEVYSEDGLFGLEQNGVRITDPIYVFLGCYHNEPKFKYPVFSFIREKYTGKLQREYSIGEIRTCYSGGESLFGIYQQAYIEDIYKDIIKVENSGKKGLENLYIGKTIYPCDIADEIYRPIYIDFDKEYANPDIAIVEIGEKHNLINYLTGKKISPKAFDHVIFLDSKYVLFMEYNHVQLKKLCTFYVENIGPEFTSVENLITYLLGLEELDYEIGSLKKIYELIAKLYELI